MVMGLTGSHKAKAHRYVVGQPGNFAYSDLAHGVVPSAVAVGYREDRP